MPSNRPLPHPRTPVCMHGPGPPPSWPRHIRSHTPHLRASLRACVGPRGTQGCRRPPAHPRTLESTPPHLGACAWVPQAHEVVDAPPLHIPAHSGPHPHTLARVRGSHRRTRLSAPPAARTDAVALSASAYTDALSPPSPPPPPPPAAAAPGTTPSSSPLPLA
eukprot:364376-Chlamydomonas_euryale.AAC.1